MTPAALWRVAVVVVIAAAALVGLRAVATNTREAAAPTAVASPPGEPTVTVEPSVSPSADVTPAVSPTPSRRVLTPKPLPKAQVAPQDVAERFVAAWLATGHGKKAWLARLRPLVSGELYDGFTASDITSVPKGRVQPGTRLASKTSSDAVVVVPTSRGALQVTLARQPQGWVATSIDQAAA